jgi:hypothetical protein
MFDITIIILCLIVADCIYIYFLQTSKSRLNPLLAIINGRIFTRFFRGWLWFAPCLTGIWQGKTVEVVLNRAFEYTYIFVSLFSRCSSPSSKIIIYSPGSLTNPVSVPINPASSFFRKIPGFKIPEANIRVISDTDNESQIRHFLNPSRLKIIEDIFSQGFNHFEIQQNISSECFLRVDYRHQNYGFF